MSSSGLRENQKFWKEDWWKLLRAAEDLKVARKFDSFLEAHGIDESEALKCVEHLKTYGIEVRIVDGHIYPIAKDWKISLDFSFSEWMAFQEYLIKCSKVMDSQFVADRIVAQKMKYFEKIHEKYLYYKNEKIQFIGDKRSKKMELWLLELDQAIVSKRVVKLTFFNHKEVQLYPERIVYLDGTLCLIGEEKFDKTLAYFGLEDIANVELSEFEVYDSRFTTLEINEFINASRLVNGREERLILKIFAQNNTEFMPRFHHLGSPFVTANSEGDLIWAATMEVCDPFFEWLYQMRESIEILDPGHIKKEFNLYCEIKNLEKSKKAG